MVRRVSTSTAAAILIAAAGTAGAAPVLSTPVIPSLIGGATLQVCQALNVGQKPGDLTLELVNANSGATLATFTGSVAPGAALTRSGTFTSINTYCRVTGLSSKRGKITYFVVSSSNSILMSVTAP